MAEEKRTDFSEADLVMQQLRAQLQASDGAPAEAAPAEVPTSAPTQEIDEKVEEPAPAVEEAPAVAVEAPTPAVEEGPAVVAEEPTPAVEEAPAVVAEEPTPAVEEAPAVAVEAPTPAVEEAPTVVAKEPTLAVEEAPAPAAAENPLIEDDEPLEIVEAEVEAAVAQAPQKRKKRLRIPRFDSISHLEAPAPLDSTAREEKKKRAAALAGEAEDSLYWQQTPVGRTPRYAPQRGASVVSAAATKDSGRSEKKRREPKPATSDVIEEEVLGLTPNAPVSAPAQGKPASIIEKPASVVEKPASVVEKPAPVVEKAAPVMEKATPVIEKPVPVVEKPAPVAEEVAPVAEEVAPVAEEVAPVAEEVAPVAEEVAPVAEEVAPVAEEVAPVAEEVAPVAEEVAPVAEEVAPVAEEVAPAEVGEAPVDGQASAVTAAVQSAPLAASEAPATAPARDGVAHSNDFLTASRRRGLRGRAMREQMARKADENANLTVEQLLSDIFGEGQGPAGHAWLSADKTEPTATPLPDHAVPAVAHVAPLTPEEEAADAPTVMLGGQALVLPDEAALAKGRHTPESESDVKQPSPADTAPDEAPSADGEGSEVPLFSAFFVKRRRDGALPRPRLARRSADQLAFKRQLEESEQELELLVDLDYEEELGEVIGFEKIKAYHERRLNGKTERRAAHRRHKQKYEYTAHAHDIGLSKFYAKQRRTHIISLAVMAFLLLVLFMFERSATIRSFFGETAGDMHKPLYLCVGLVLFLVGVFMLRRHLVEGLWQLLRLAPNDNSLCAVVVLVTLCYHVLLFFVPLNGAMTLFLSPAMASLCLLALSEFFNWYREFSAFRVVSSKQQKYALLPRVSVGGKEGSARERLFETERHTRVWYVRPVGFIRDYFANTKRKSNHQRALGAQLLLLWALSLVLALFVMVLGGTVTAAVHTAFVCFLLSVPAVSVLLTSLPMFCGTCLCLGRRGAIIGEEAVYDSEGSVELVLPDNACFKQMPHEQFELVKGCDAKEATVMIRALLDKLGSALAPTVEVPEELRLSPDTVTLTDVSARGVAAVISGERKVPVLLGDVSYLQQYGIHVSPKKDGRYEEIRRNMLCVAIGNRLTALFIARYRPEAGMQALAEALEGEGVRLVIRSADPGIHDEMLKDLFADADQPPCVMKPLAAESDLAADRVDATVVAVGSAREVAHTFVTCRRIRRAVRLGRVWQALSLVLGAGIAATLTYFGFLTKVPAFAVALYAFLWSGAHAMSAYFTLREKGEME